MRRVLTNSPALACQLAVMLAGIHPPVLLVHQVDGAEPTSLEALRGPLDVRSVSEAALPEVVTLARASGVITLITLVAADYVVPDGSPSPGSAYLQVNDQDISNSPQVAALSAWLAAAPPEVTLLTAWVTEEADAPV